MLKIDLSNVEFTHYRLAKKREQDIKLKSSADARLDGIKDIGTATAKDDEEERLSVVIKRLNGIFGTKFTHDDLISYAEAIADKIRENERVRSR